MNSVNSVQSPRQNQLAITKPFIEFPATEVEQSVPQRFERVVQRDPKAIAVKTAFLCLTFGELNQAANRLALVLDRMIGKLSQPVVILCEHDASAIIAYLGVLKAGQIAIAFDTSFPLAMLGALLDDSQAEILVADHVNLALARRLAGSFRQVLDLEDVDPSISGENFQHAIMPEMPAEIRYTSGSSGRPKGIVRNHRRILFSAMKRVNLAHIGAGDRLLIQRHLSLGSKDVMRGLLSGASVTPFDIRKYGLTKLATVIAEEKLTHFAFVPSIFRNFVRSLGLDTQFSTVRLIELGGEPISKGDIESCRQHFSRDCMILHKYSSGETGNICEFLIGADTEIVSSVVPAGYPIEGKDVSIVDETGAPAGINQIGEIVVKSRYLADGYWRNSELTNQQFFTDESNPVRSGYFTGDLGRLLPDGCLIHLGRKDAEIKIRGYRVAPSEIEMTLLEHPEIKDAGIAAWSRESGEKYLSAYVVPREKQILTAGAVRDFLREKLPDFMIPAQYVFLTDLPRTGGKLDRKQLPKPESDREYRYVAPTSELETQLVSLFEALLDRRPIGVRDNFMDLGGDSMLVVQLVTKIEQLFGQQILPAVVFYAPTVEQLASYIKQNQLPRIGTSLLPLQPYGTRAPFFWTHGDHSSALLPRFLPPDQPVYSLEHQGADGKRARYKRVDSIAAHYLAEIREVQRRGPYYIGGYSFGAVVAFEMARQLANRGEEVGLLVLLDPPGAVSHRSIVVSPDSSDDSAQAAGRRTGVRKYFDAMKSRSLGEKFNYVLSGSLKKVLLAISALTTALVRLHRRLFCLGAIAFNQPIPHELRSFYILNIYHRARSKYRPEPYHGSALLFASAGRSQANLNYWGSLILGGIDYCRLQGDHDAVRREPGIVCVWAEKLQQCLSAAQAKRQSGPE